VRPADDPVLPWVVVDETGEPVEPVRDFLRSLLACGNSPASCRSYGYDLLRWFRFLAAVGVCWQRAQRQADQLQRTASLGEVGIDALS
jgi:hypothetical protein